MKIVQQTLVLVFIASLLSPVLSVAQTSGVDTESTEKVLTVDTRLLELLDNPVTRPVVEKHLPQLVARISEDFELARFFYDSTLRDLSLDDAHVIGFDEELLNKLAADLATAQSKG